MKKISFLTVESKSICPKGRRMIITYAGFFVFPTPELINEYTCINMSYW